MKNHDVKEYKQNSSLTGDLKAEKLKTNYLSLSKLTIFPAIDQTSALGQVSILTFVKSSENMRA